MTDSTGPSDEAPKAASNNNNNNRRRRNNNRKRRSESNASAPNTDNNNTNNNQNNNQKKNDNNSNSNQEDDANKNNNRIHENGETSKPKGGGTKGKSKTGNQQSNNSSNSNKNNNNAKNDEPSSNDNANANTNNNTNNNNTNNNNNNNTSGVKKPKPKRRRRGNNNNNNKQEDADPSPTPMETDNTDAMEVDDSPTDQPRFADLTPTLHPPTQRALTEDFGYEFMTPVQAATWPVITSGRNCLARAKTGTGKTLGFLLPGLQMLLSSKTNDGAIWGLIISPTRELAQQIATEARRLLQFHPSMHVGTLVGGTNMNKDVQMLKNSKSRAIAFLVGTPGRLLDHLEQNTQGIATPRLAQHLQLLILDEADRLLDMGFKQELAKIIQGHLQPSQDRRQTLLFSATFSPQIEQIMVQTVALNKKDNYTYVDTVGEEEQQTHLHVKQQLVVVPGPEQLPALHYLLHEHIQEYPQNAKIVVFFTTARMVQFVARLWQQQQKKQKKKSSTPPVYEIHSRLSQSKRQANSDAFAKTQPAILMSSDVAARGMDYPGVTMVVQVGLTLREAYIHRLGRTARAGQAGQGILLCRPEEQDFLQTELKDLPLETRREALPSDQMPSMDDYRRAVQADKELMGSAEATYRAWLGYYNGYCRKLRWSKDDLVRHGNDWWDFTTGRADDRPSFLKRTLKKMGLQGVSGLKVE